MRHCEVLEAPQRVASLHHPCADGRYGPFSVLWPPSVVKEAHDRRDVLILAAQIVSVWPLRRHCFGNLNLVHDSENAVLPLAARAAELATTLSASIESFRRCASVRGAGSVPTQR